MVFKGAYRFAAGEFVPISKATATGFAVKNFAVAKSWDGFIFVVGKLLGQGAWNLQRFCLKIFKAKFALQDVVNAIFEGLVGIAKNKNGMLIGDHAKAVGTPIFAIRK